MGITEPKYYESLFILLPKKTASPNSGSDFFHCRDLSDSTVDTDESPTGSEERCYPDGPLRTFPGNKEADHACSHQLLQPPDKNLSMNPKEFQRKPYEQTIRVFTVFFSALIGIALKDILDNKSFSGTRGDQWLCFTAGLFLWKLRIATNKWTQTWFRINCTYVAVVVVLFVWQQASPCMIPVAGGISLTAIVLVIVFGLFLGWDLYHQTTRLNESDAKTSSP